MYVYSLLYTAYIQTQCAEKNITNLPFIVVHCNEVVSLSYAWCPLVDINRFVIWQCGQLRVLYVHCIVDFGTTRIF